MADRRAWLALLAVQLLFGVWPVAGKEVLGALSPIQLMAARVVGAAVLLVVVVALVGPRGRPRMPVATHGGLLVALSLLGIVVNQSLFIMGLDRTSPVHATLLITTIPVFTYATAVVMGREAWGPRRLAGIAMALAGAVYLVGLTQVRFGWDTAVGDLMILANAVAFSVYLVLAKPLNERYDVLHVTMWTFLLACAVMVPAGIWTGAAPAVAGLDGARMGWLAFIIIGPSLLTYVLNAVALRHVPASTVAVFIYIQPAVTAVAAWWVQGDRPGLDLVPAAALVFAGVWLVARRRPRILEGGDAAME